MADATQRMGFSSRSGLSRLAATQRGRTGGWQRWQVEESLPKPRAVHTAAADARVYSRAGRNRVLAPRQGGDHDPTVPPLTLHAVREWVGDFEIGKGRPYSDGVAVSGTTRTTDTLRATVRARAPIRTGSSATDAGTVLVGRLHLSGRPRGEVQARRGVRCWRISNGRSGSSPVTDLEGQPGGRATSPSWWALIVLFVAAARPELKPLLAFPLPGFAATTTPDTRWYFLWLAVEVIPA